LVYKNDPILADIQGTCVNMQEFVPAADTTLIKRILELRLGTNVDEELALRVQQWIEELDSEIEHE